MVEYVLNLDDIFGSLSDMTRRDILRRVSKREMTVTQVAQPYGLSLAAISKHLGVLERARLIVKHKRGKQHFVQLSPAAFKDAEEYLQYYTQFWESRFDSLEKYLSKEVNSE